MKHEATPLTGKRQLLVARHTTQLADSEDYPDESESELDGPGVPVTASVLCQWRQCLGLSTATEAQWCASALRAADVPFDQWLMM